MHSLKLKNLMCIENLRWELKMDSQQEELKDRLLKIAREQSVAIGRDINKTMQESIKLEKNETEKWVKITFLKEQEMGLMFNRENFDKFIGQFTLDGKPIEYEMVEESNFLLFKFQDAFVVDKVYDYYDYFFFGDFQSQQINTMLNSYIQDLMHETTCSAGGDCSCGCGQHDMPATDSFFKSLEKHVIDISKKAQDKINASKD